MKITLLIFLFLVSFAVKADMFSDVLGKYTNNVLVCTGIASGEIFARAMEVNCKTSSFSEIYGIEENAILVNHSQKFVIPKYKIDYNPTIKYFQIYFANPLEDLGNIIKGINQKITFVLASQFPDWTKPKKKNCIIKELSQIKSHPIKEHTILIDYIYFENIDLEIIKKSLLEINPNYKFKLENGGHIGKEKNAILAAYLDN